MAANAFQFRGALGGLIAGDQELRKAQQERVATQKLALEAKQLADQIRRDRQFKAQERQMALDRDKQLLLKDIRENTLGEEFDRGDRVAEQQIKQAQSRIQTKQADVSEKFLERKTESDIENVEARTKDIPLGRSTANRQVAVSERNAATSEGRAATEAAREARIKKVADARHASIVAQSAAEKQKAENELEQAIALSESNEETAAMRREARRVDVDIKKEHLRRLELETSRLEQGLPKTPSRPGAAKQKNDKDRLTAHDALERRKDDGTWDTFNAADPKTQREILNRMAEHIAAMRQGRIGDQTNWGDIALQQLIDNGELIVVPKDTFFGFGESVPAFDLNSNLPPVEQGVPPMQYVPDTGPNDLDTKLITKLETITNEKDLQDLVRLYLNASGRATLPPYIVEQYPHFFGNE